MASAKIARAASSRTLAASATLLEERSNHDQNADELRHRDRIRGARVRMERVPGRASLRRRAGDAAAAFALELPVRFPAGWREPKSGALIPEARFPPVPDARRPGALYAPAGGKLDAYDRSTPNLPPPHAARPLAVPGFPEAVALAHHHVVRRADHQPRAAADRGAVAARDADADGYSRGARNIALRAVQPARGCAARPRAQAAGRNRSGRRARSGVDRDPHRGVVRRA